MSWQDWNTGSSILCTHSFIQPTKSVESSLLIPFYVTGKCFLGGSIRYQSLFLSCTAILRALYSKIHLKFFGGFDETWNQCCYSLTSKWTRRAWSNSSSVLTVGEQNIQSKLKTTKAWCQQARHSKINEKIITKFNFRMDGSHGFEGTVQFIPVEPDWKFSKIWEKMKVLNVNKGTFEKFHIWEKSVVKKTSLEIIIFLVGKLRLESRAAML